MQRALFFFVAGLICLALFPVTPGDLRWVPAGAAAVYALLAVASWLDARSTASRRS